MVIQMVTRPLLSLVDPPLASKPATFELSVLAETLWEVSAPWGPSNRSVRCGMASFSESCKSIPVHRERDL